MKFASGFEIFEHCKKIADRFGAYDKGILHTTVTSTEWIETESKWLVKTDRGDVIKARFVILANGVLTQPKLAKIKGMEDFEGVTFHTSRWDYSQDPTITINITLIITLTLTLI